MLYQISGLGIVMLMLGIATLRRNPLYSPLVISSFSWLIVFFAGIFFHNQFYSLSDHAFIAWLIWFLITSTFYFLLAPVVGRYKQSPRRKLPVDYSLFMAILIVWLVYRVWVVGNSGPEHFFLNLRLSSNGLEGFEPLGLVGRFYPVSFSLFLFEHVYTHPSNRRQRIMCWIWMLAYAVATMGKFAVLTPVLAWVVIQGVQGRLPVKKLVLLGCGTFFLMMAAHFVRSGSADGGTTILDVLAVYIYSPIVALGYMDIPSAHQWGSHVFRFLYAVGSSLGILSEPVDVILPYVNVPRLTNVYTVMQPFYHDFSLTGVAIGAVGYGVFFSVLFFFACRGRGFFLVLYSGLAIALFGQFIGELFFTMFSGNLQFFLVLLFIFAISKKEKNVC